MNDLYGNPNERERKKTTVAFLLSVVIHLLLILLTAFILSRSPVTPEPEPEPEPIELTILPPAHAPTPEATPYLATTEQQRSETAPEKPVFESDKNTLAASEQPAESALPLPSQEGREAGTLEFQNAQVTLGPKPAEAAPVPPLPQTPPQPPTPVTKNEPTPSEPKQEEAKPEPTPEPDQLALLELKPPKAELPEPEPKPPSPPPAPPPRPKAYQPETRVTRIQGGISTRGRNAASALSTPMGRFKKQLSDAIGSRWYYYVQNDMGLLNIGTVVIRFVVRQNGKVEDVQVISNTSNESFATTSIRSIIEAEIPEIPPDVASVLGGGKLEVDYTFTIMNN